MSSLIDRIVEDAIARGTMDNLPFQGEPTPSRTTATSTRSCG
jgi:hypothetical protein